MDDWHRTASPIGASGDGSASRKSGWSGVDGWHFARAAQHGAVADAAARRQDQRHFGNWFQRERLLALECGAAEAPARWVALLVLYDGVTMIELNERDRQALQSLLAIFSLRAQHKITLNTLLNNWRRFVADVERGYPAGVYDYDNDLASRDLLQDLVERGPAALQTQLTVLLVPWDERFRAATTERTEPVSGNPPEKRWWWNRVPKKESQD